MWFAGGSRMQWRARWSEPRHDKTNKTAVRPAKTQISPVWSESSLSAWRKLASFATFDTPGISRCQSQHVSVESSSLLHHSIYLWFICFTWWSIDELENLHEDRTTECFEPSFYYWAHIADSNQSGRMLIWVFAQRTLIFLVLSCRGSSPYHGEERDSQVALPHLKILCYAEDMSAGDIGRSLMLLHPTEPNF